MEFESTVKTKGYQTLIHGYIIFIRFESTVKTKCYQTDLISDVAYMRLRVLLVHKVIKQIMRGA